MRDMTKRLMGLLTSVALLTGCGATEPQYSSIEESAYKSVVNMYLGDNDISSYNKGDVISDIKEVCENLKTEEYRSYAMSKASLVEEGISYELALTEGVKSYCSSDWGKAKKME